MRPALILLALLLAGCGKTASHAPETAAIPPDTSFADIAGVYQATVTQASGDIGAPYHVNDAATVTISPSGNVTWDTGVPPAISYGKLSRTPAGFATAPWSIPNGEYEQATAPADLSTLTLESTRLSVLYGRVIFALVKVSSG